MSFFSFSDIYFRMFISFFKSAIYMNTTTEKSPLLPWTKDNFYIRPLKLDYEFPAGHIFSGHNEATLSLFIIWLHFIIVHYVRSKTLSNHGIISLDVLQQNEKEHNLFLSNSNCLQSLRNDREHNEGSLNFHYLPDAIGLPLLLR